jgi:hypothetical protein
MAAQAAEDMSAAARVSPRTPACFKVRIAMVSRVGSLLPFGCSKHALLVVANVDLRHEHAKKRGPLTALLLAHNWFGDSFFEASCRLGGKSTGRCL